MNTKFLPITQVYCPRFNYFVGKLNIFSNNNCVFLLIFKYHY